MPVIKVWCLPKSPEKKLRELHKSIVEAVCAVKQLGLRGEQDMMVLFPPDSMQYGLGSEIIIEITGLFENEHRTHEVVQILAFSVGRSVNQLFPKAKNVECFVYPFKQDAAGFWTSSTGTASIASLPILAVFGSEPRTPLRTRIQLNLSRVKTVGDLLKLNKEDLRERHNFGKKALAELERLLKENLNVALGNGMAKFSWEK